MDHLLRLRLNPGLKDGGNEAVQFSADVLAGEFPNEPKGLWFYPAVQAFPVLKICDLRHLEKY